MRVKKLRNFFVKSARLINSKLPKNKRVRAGLLAGLIIFSTTIYIFNSRAQAAVTVDTSALSTASQYSQQRKSWHDGTRYWSAFYNGGGGMEFWYSTDGVTWSQNTTVTSPLPTSDFSIEADGSNAFIVYTCPGVYTDICIRKAASYPGTSFTWGSAAQALISRDDIPANDTYGYTRPTISRDTNNNLWVAADEDYDDGSLGYSRPTAVKSTSPNDITSWGSSSTLASESSTDGFTSIYPLSGGDMLATWHLGSQGDSNNQFAGRIYSSGSWGATQVFGVGLEAGLGSNISFTTSTSADEGYSSYVDLSGKLNFRKYIDATQTTPVNIDDASNAGVMSGGRSVVRDSVGNVYTMIRKSGDSKCHLYKSTDNGANWTEQDSADAPLGCSNPTLAIDSTNMVHIAYMYANTFDDVKYVTFSAGQFSAIDTVPAHGNFPTFIDMAIDSNDKPHIVDSWSAGTSTINYDTKVSGSWTSVTIESIATTNASITINEDNFPEFSYIDTTNSDLTAVAADRNNPTLLAHFSIQDVDTSVNNVSGTAGSSIGVDSDGNTFIAYVDENGATDFLALVRHTDADAWTSWQTPTTAGAIGKEPSISISSKVINVLYQDSADDIGLVSTESYGTNSYTRPQVSSLQSGTLRDVSVRWAYKYNNNQSLLDFVYSNGTDIFYANSGAWTTPVVVDSNAGNNYTSITRNSSNGDLYIFWIRSDDTFYSKSSTPYTSWTSPTSLYTTGTNAWLTSQAVTSTSKVPYIFTSGTGSPYDVKWDAVILNAPPGQTSLTSPGNGSQTIDTTPDLQMSATDPDGDSVKYKLYLYNTTATSSGNCTGSAVSGSPWDQNLAGTGWSTGTTAYASAATATFTVPTTLSFGAGYCWQAQASDPSGSTNFGTISSARVFDLNNVPGTPTLSSPSNAATLTPLTGNSFVSAATDPDFDPLHYHIKIFNTTAQSGGDCSGSVFEQQDQSSAQGGWSSSTYSSGSNATYVNQTSLVRGSSYCWQTRAKDSTATNTFGNWSSPRTFTVNGYPNAPTLIMPVSTTTGVPVRPELRLSSTDDNGDYVQYKLEFCTVNTWPCVNGSLVTVTQSSSQTGWKSQSASSGTAYTSGQTAIHTLQSSLTANTTWYWRAYAQDPGGANGYGTASSISSFTTASAPPNTVNIGGGTTIYGGTTFGN